MVVETQVKSRPNPKKLSRTVYKVKLNEFLNIAGQISTGTMMQGEYDALDIMRKCLYAQKGLEKRDITVEESAKLLRR